MPKPASCFVIIGYGKKTSYANGKVRVLDLDETYNILIKPVFDALKIPCYRAIDKNISGSIDQVMLQEIKNADLALVDLSTLNANVMWELGVRHALKPRHTIMICEKEQMNPIPFDINHFVVHQYTHSEEGIPYKEVERFRGELTKIVEGLSVLDPENTDSPVFTFLKEEEETIPNVIKMSFKAHIPEPSFADLMKQAEEDKKAGNFIGAFEGFSQAGKKAENNISLAESIPFIISRQALCIYKSKQPDEKTALLKAKEILETLEPHQSHDIEVLGLSGAIQKRLFELTGENQYLDSSIEFYNKGFEIKQDYYNGINAASMLYRKAGLQKQAGEDWEDTKIRADYTRNKVLDIATKLEAESGFSEKSDAIWILLTIAEAWNYKGNAVKMDEYEEKAGKMAAEKNDLFAMASYQEQKQKIHQMLNT